MLPGVIWCYLVLADPGQRAHLCRLVLPCDVCHVVDVCNAFASNPSRERRLLSTRAGWAPRSKQIPVDCGGQVVALE